jgi:hypothetical protein
MSSAPTLHDHPYAGRPHRVYFALTNHCNRACPWCSTFSSPAGDTWITPPQVLAALPTSGRFEAQLEGGEPTLHPALHAIAAALRGTGRCAQLVLCTNGVVLPRSASTLADWLAPLGEPLLVKLSINHYLLAHDPGLIDLAHLLREVLDAMGGERQVIFNVRRRQGTADNDSAVAAAVAAAGLADIANVFFLQRYGRAAGEAAWEPPWLAGHDFRLVNPDGRQWGTDLIGRSQGMGRLR